MTLQTRRLWSLLACLLAALVCAFPAQAQGDGPTATPAALSLIINGQINSGTAGIAISPGLEVTLHIMRQTGDDPLAVTRYQAVSGEAGQFHFENIPAQTGDLVFASVAFEGIQQSSSLISLGPAPEEFSLPLTVYGTTADPNVIRVTSATHTLDLLPGAALQVLSAYELRNLSDRMLVMAEQTPDGQPIALRFPLPIGAVGVAFDQPDAFHIGGSDIAPVVEDMRPVRPGEVHEVIFSYQIPYSGGAVIDQDYLYRTDVVEILVPDDAGLRLEGGQPIVSLSAGTPRTAVFDARADTSLNPARPYTRYRMNGELLPGDRLVFSLEGGAAPTPTLAAGTSAFSGVGNIIVLILLGGALLGAVILGALLVRRLPGARPR